MFLESIPPPTERLDLQGVFSFSCGPELHCFGSCCRNKHLPLTPYDVLRLTRGLQISSDLFLETHALYTVDPTSGFPVVSLKLNEGGKCPFVREQGCLLYENRPTACRLFPLTRLSRPSTQGGPVESLFSLLHPPQCMGLQQGRLWTVEAWVEDQGLRPYIEFNDLMLPLLFHPRAPRNQPLAPPQLQKIFVALYNLDVFREMLLNTRLLEGIQGLEGAGIGTSLDPENLLRLGHLYLAHTLFQGPA